MIYPNNSKVNKYKPHSYKIGIYKLILMFSVILIVICGFQSFHPSIAVQKGIQDNMPEGKGLTVGFDPDFPPYHFVQDGQPTGFSIDLFNQIAENNNFSVEYVPLSVVESRQALLDQSIDVILSINYTKELAEDVRFTESYIESSVSLMAHSDSQNIQNVNDLSDKVVAAQRETVAYNFLENIRDIQLNVTTGQNTALQLLVENRVDAYVGDRFTQQYFKNNYNLADYEIITSYVAPVEYSMGVRGSDQDLLNTLNSSLFHLENEGIYNEIYQDWFVDEGLQLERLIRTIILIGAVTLSGFAVFMAVGYRWNKQLQREVDKKTKDLINTNQLKNQILESSFRGLITYDLQGEITSANSMAKKLAGEYHDLEGRHVIEIELFFLMLSPILDNFEDVNVRDKIIGREVSWGGQKEMAVRYNIYPLFDFQNEVIGTILSFEDITEEKKLRAEAFERDKNVALNRIVAGICHEIRNPLTSIKTFIELLPKKFDDPEFRTEISNYVPKEMDRVDNLISNLFDYAKPDKPKYELAYVEQVVDSCIVLSRKIIDKAGIELEVDIKQGMQIRIDKNQIQQVLLNLLLNSVAAIEEKRRTQISTSQKAILQAQIGSETDFDNSGGEKNKISVYGYKKSGKVIISVTDTGIGMSEDEITNAVEPFYTTKSDGSGLGLALSKQYVEENGGQLTIISSKNNYTTVFMEFDIKE